jgi:hypothetical protein
VIEDAIDLVDSEERAPNPSSTEEDSTRIFLTPPMHEEKKKGSRRKQF